MTTKYETVEKFKVTCFKPNGRKKYQELFTTKDAADAREKQLREWGYCVVRDTVHDRVMKPAPKRKPKKWEQQTPAEQAATRAKNLHRKSQEKALQNRLFAQWGERHAGAMTDEQARVQALRIAKAAGLDIDNAEARLCLMHRDDLNRLVPWHGRGLPEVAWTYVQVGKIERLIKIMPMNFIAVTARGGTFETALVEFKIACDREAREVMKRKQRDAIRAAAKGGA